MDDEKLIAELKAKHNLNDVYVMNVPVGDSGEIITGYFRRPTFDILDAAMSLQETKPMTSKAIIVKSCFLAGDKRIIEDDQTLKNACTSVNDLVGIFQSYLKKK